MRRPMLMLILAGCAFAPAFAQHRPESPLPPYSASTHVPRLAEEAAPARPTKTKSVFGLAMTLLIADLQSQQQRPATADDADIPGGVATQAGPVAPDVAVPSATQRARVALQDGVQE